MPVLISLAAAAATTEGVRKFSVPSWSVEPNRPHALPGGPLGSSGSDENAITGTSDVGWMPTDWCECDCILESYENTATTQTSILSRARPFQTPSAIQGALPSGL